MTIETKQAHTHGMASSQRPERLLVAHPDFDSSGGGNGLALMAMEALLKAGFEVTLATLKPPSFRRLNRQFGTRLSVDDLNLRVARSLLLRRVYQSSLPLTHLKMSLLERHTKRLWHDEVHQLCISTNNEMAFPEIGVQYIHFPRSKRARPEVDYLWYHKIPGLLRFYYGVSGILSQGGREQWKNNVSMANSGFIKKLYQCNGGGSCRVVYPPVNGELVQHQWSQRKNRFVALGRIHRGKRCLEIILMIEQLRAAGNEVTLQMIGDYDCDRAYQENLEQMQRTLSWLQITPGLSRQEMFSVLVESRYGIHAMYEEHFGMAVAEMQCAGMIVFAPDSGGPMEILGHSKHQLYPLGSQCDTSQISRAAAAIDHIIKDKQLLDQLQQDVKERQNWFSRERFDTEFVETTRSALSKTEARTQ